MNPAGTTIKYFETRQEGTQPLFVAGDQKAFTGSVAEAVAALNALFLAHEAVVVVPVRSLHTWDDVLSVFLAVSALLNIYLNVPNYSVAENKRSSEWCDVINTRQQCTRVHFPPLPALS